VSVVGIATDGVPSRNRAQLTAIKVAHTLAWFSVEASVAYVLFAGVTRRSDRRAGLAAGVVAGETLIFAANGFRCPLTRLAEEIGAEHGSVTDLYLPEWLAHHLPVIHVPVIVLAALLHGRNLWMQRASPPAIATGEARRAS
jgi:hypothetical protein